MDFFEFKQWMKERDLTFELEGWSSCIKDTIIVKKDGKPIYSGDYDRWVDYNDAVRAIESGDTGDM